MASIKTIAGFSIGDKTPIDTRFTVQSKSDLSTLLAYEGLECWVTDEKKKYRYEDGEWEKVSNGSEIIKDIAFLKDTKEAVVWGEEERPIMSARFAYADNENIKEFSYKSAEELLEDYYEVGDVYYLQDAAGMFYRCNNLLSAIVPAARLANISGMFHSCENLKEVDLTTNVATDWGWPNEAQITYARGAFCKCTSLDTVSLEPYNIDGYNQYMFPRYCDTMFEGASLSSSNSWLGVEAVCTGIKSAEAMFSDTTISSDKESFFSLYADENIYISHIFRNSTAPSLNVRLRLEERQNNLSYCFMYASVKSVFIGNTGPTGSESVKPVEVVEIRELLKDTVVGKDDEGHDNIDLHICIAPTEYASYYNYTGICECIVGAEATSAKYSIDNLSVTYDYIDLRDVNVTNAHLLSGLTGPKNLVKTLQISSHGGDFAAKWTVNCFTADEIFLSASQEDVKEVCFSNLRYVQNLFFCRILHLSGIDNLRVNLSDVFFNQKHLSSNEKDWYASLSNSNMFFYETEDGSDIGFFQPRLAESLQKVCHLFVIDEAVVRSDGTTGELTCHFDGAIKRSMLSIERALLDASSTKECVKALYDWTNNPDEEEYVNETVIDKGVHKGEVINYFYLSETEASYLSNEDIAEAIAKGWTLYVGTKKVTASA